MVSAGKYQLGSECKMNSWPEYSVDYIVSTELSGRGSKSLSGQFSVATSKNPSMVNTICVNSFCHQRDYLCRISLKANVATDEGND